MNVTSLIQEELGEVSRAVKDESGVGGERQGRRKSISFSICSIMMKIFLIKK